MAERRLINWLVRGVEFWNEQDLQQEAYLDLTQENISQVLHNAGRLTESGRPDLRGYNLAGVDLSGSLLVEVDLTNAKVDWADFKGAWLQDADLTGTSCDFAKFTSARLDNTVLDQTSLFNSDLTGANLKVSRFWKAKLFAPWDSESQSRFNFTNRADLEDIVDGVPKLLSQINILIQNYASQELGESTRFYYRGEASDRWSLTPGVMRESRFRESEEEMLVDMRSRRPEDFAYDTTAIGQMVIAQHHRLPTRLLDVTSNPLVALFHATADTSQQNNGRLHILALPKGLVKPFNSDTVSVLANFARLRSSEQIVLLGKTEEDTKDDADPGRGPVRRDYVNYKDALNRLYQLIRLEKPSFAERINPRDFLRVFVVEPQRTFERLRAQSGAFLLSAFHDRFEEQSIGGWNRDIPRYHHYTLSVPAEAKQHIRNELSTVNITRESLLPSLEETAKAVKDRVRTRSGDRNI